MLAKAGTSPAGPKLSYNKDQSIDCGKQVFTSISTGILERSTAILSRSSPSVVRVVVIRLISKTRAPVAQATLRHSPKRQHKNKRGWHKWKALGFLCKQAYSSNI
ncbi:hypothetical protein U9M48_039840 [Paspalum notatum var. saurae]|uniref:Uncharacterized protein n=1 Tax=Paspalum notatum var. saurae TaxID=547442 RepID=A0AAQ3UJQ7_PASNO